MGNFVLNLSEHIEKMKYDNERDWAITEKVISNIYNDTVQAIITVRRHALGTAINGNCFWIRPLPECSIPAP